MELENQKERDKIEFVRWRRQLPDFINQFLTLLPQNIRSLSRNAESIRISRLIPRIRGAAVRNKIPSPLISKDSIPDFPEDNIPDVPGDIPDIPEDESDDIDTPGCKREENEIRCNPNSRYRSFSGRCNNLKNPKFGKHTTTLKRLLPNEYADGISRPRAKSVLSGPLPNVRTVSQVVHSQRKKPKIDKRHSLMLMQWGQYLDHDITLTPMTRGINNTILDCERCDSNRLHRSCFPILVPTGDDFFPIREERSARRKCIPFTR